MDIIQYTAENAFNKILRLEKIICLEKKLKYRVCKNYHIKSIKKVYFKLFKVLSHKISKINFPKYEGEPFALTLYLFDENFKKIFSNILQFGRDGSINNLNK